MTIEWIEAELPENPGWMGDGLCLCRERPLPERWQLLAFVEEFAWVRGAEHVVVRYVAARMPAEKAARELLRADLERRLRARSLGGDCRVPGYLVWPNA